MLFFCICDNIEVLDERKDFLLRQRYEYRKNLESNCFALDVLKRSIKVLIESFSDDGHQVAYMESRIKSENSYLNKVDKNLSKNKLLPYEDFHDIVGCRVVFLSISDIKDFISLIKKSEDFKIIEEKNYISESKDSGYRSYHLILEMPLRIQEEEKTVKVELQLRTILMDIFAREEHKLSYKGNCSAEDKKILKELSDRLLFYDINLSGFLDVANRTFSSDRYIPTQNIFEISKCSYEFEKVFHYYEFIQGEMEKMIKEIISGFSGSDDILHVSSRIKKVKSITRKIKEMNEERKAKGLDELPISIDTILYQLRDVVGFKIVCTDIDTAKEFIKYVKEYFETRSQVTMSNEKDNLEIDRQKDTGYRGYKVNLSFMLPVLNGTKEIQTELIIRTMVMDAWALQDDRIYSKTNVPEALSTNLRTLSGELLNLEYTLNELRTHRTEKYKAKDIISELDQYEKTKKKPKKLVLEKKDEE